MEKKHTKLLVFAGLCGVAFLWWLYNYEESQANQAATNGANTGSPWGNILASGGMPTWGPPYWGANAPVANGATINLNVDPAWVADNSTGYMPMFGLVGFSTPVSNGL